MVIVGGSGCKGEQYASVKYINMSINKLAFSCEQMYHGLSVATLRVIGSIVLLLLLHHSTVQEDAFFQ